MAEIKHWDAFLDWCKGKTNKEIAKKYRVTESTAYTWSSREKWQEAKAAGCHLEEQEEQLRDALNDYVRSLKLQS